MEKNDKIKSAILKAIYYKNPLSISELSKIVHKSIPLVSSLLQDLIGSESIIEIENAQSTGGRRPSVYKLNPNLGYTVSVSVDQYYTKLLIYSITHEIILPVQEIELSLKNDKATTDTLIEFINTCIATSGLDKEKIFGIGIGMPGFVNVQTGENNSFLKVDGNTSLQNYLSTKTNLPVFIDNDSSLIALAELRFGEAKGKNEALVVNIGWGTGLGIIVNNQLYRGSSGFAGEFSHIPLAVTNKLCSCGKKGCLEVETSLLVMAEKAMHEIKNGADSVLKEKFIDSTVHQGIHFIHAALLHDPLALSVLSTSAFQLGKGIATLIHIMNPAVIILSGRGAKMGELMMPAIQQAINQFCIPKIAEQTQLSITKLGDNANFLAAASLVIEHIEIYKKTKLFARV